jgi:protein ImuA
MRAMEHPLLSRCPHHGGPTVPLMEGVALPAARVHEACGRARRSFAMMLGRATRGHIYWIATPWAADPLNAEGAAPFLDPARITFLSPNRPEDVLWCMEEILRSGAVPLVVADIPGFPGLTPVRRMHLAAETGLDVGLCQPVGLLLTPGDGGAQGVETRWRMDRLRARTAPQKRWSVRYDKAGFRPCPQEPEHPYAPTDQSADLVGAAR